MRPEVQVLPGPLPHPINSFAEEPAVRRPALLLGLLGAGLLALRRRAASRTQRDVWTEATAPPDLR